MVVQSRRIPPEVVFAVVASIVVGTSVGLFRGNAEFVVYGLVLLVLSVVVGFVHVRIGLGAWVLRAMALWAVAHMAGGLLPVPESWPIEGEQRVLYSWWIVPGLLKYDQVVHAFGFGATTWIFWQGLRSIAATRIGPPLRPTLGVLTICAFGSMGCGALNEVIEFIAVLAIPETNVGGYENTGWDLVANLVGAVVAAIMIRLRPWSAKAPPLQ